MCYSTCCGGDTHRVPSSLLTEVSLLLLLFFDPGTQFPGNKNYYYYYYYYGYLYSAGLPKSHKCAAFASSDQLTKRKRGECNRIKMSLRLQLTCLYSTQVPYLFLTSSSSRHVPFSSLPFRRIWCIILSHKTLLVD